MKSLIAIFIAITFFMIPFWILENKLNIKFNFWEQMGIQMSLMAAWYTAHFAHTIFETKEK